MKFKLDENIGARGAELLRGAGHDVSTVREQQLEGADDQTLFDTCHREARALVTLDHDFGEVLRFAPEAAHGIAVLELGPRPSLQSLLSRLQSLVEALRTRRLEGALWIVEPGRIRYHLNAADDRTE